MNLMNIISALVETLGVIVPNMDNIESTIMMALVLGFISYNHFSKGRYQELFFLDKDMTTGVMVYFGLWAMVGLHRAFYWEKMTPKGMAATIVQTAADAVCTEYTCGIWKAFYGMLATVLLIVQLAATVVAVTSLVWLYKGKNVVDEWKKLLGRDREAEEAANLFANVEVPEGAQHDDNAAANVLAELRAELAQVRRELKTTKTENANLRVQLPNLPLNQEYQ